MLKFVRITQAIAALIFFLSPLSEKIALGSGRVVVRETVHVFGTVRQGEKVVHTFAIGNTGPAELKIDRMEVSRPGITARVKPIIPSGQEQPITVQWDTGRVKGDAAGEVIVHFADPTVRPITFLLKAVVKPPLEILPSRAVFLNVFKGESAERTVTVINNETHPLEITQVEARGQHFVADVQTVESGKIYNVVVKVPPDTPPGRYLEALELYTSHAKHSLIKIAVNVLVKTNLYTFPHVVDFGPVSLMQLANNPPAVNLLTQTLLVKKREGDFEIKNVASDLPSLRIHQQPAGKSGTFRIDISLDPNELRPGKLDGALRITTEDKEFPELVVPVRGELR